MSEQLPSDHSDTPKTDAQRLFIFEAPDKGVYVPVEFARAQERRIAELEAALALIPKIASDAYEAWDSDNDSRVGKILRALAGRLPLYREDTSKVVAAIRSVTQP